MQILKRASIVLVLATTVLCWVNTVAQACAKPADPCWGALAVSDAFDHDDIAWAWAYGVPSKRAAAKDAIAECHRLLERKGNCKVVSLVPKGKCMAVVRRVYKRNKNTVFYLAFAQDVSVEAASSKAIRKCKSHSNLDPICYVESSFCNRAALD
jgi:hypothetical protein